MKKYFKKIILVLVFIFLLIFLVNIIFASLINKLSFENYINKIWEQTNSHSFSIDKIVFFSTCTSDSTINSNSTTTINNLTQFTDIAIFINNSTAEFNMENTLKAVSIKDISFNTIPNIGTPNLYYKSLTSFATPNVPVENLLDTELDFKISSENQIDYNEPILFNNCANPITLSYVNSMITDNYTIANSNPIIYDGSLLKSCNILLNDLKCSISFTILIENNLGQKFKCPVYIDIPLESDSSSIYDGSYTYIFNPNYDFFEYES